MQCLYIINKISQKYKFARGFADFNLYKFLRFRPFEFEHTNHEISPKLITVYLKMLELQVFYLPPLELSTFENTYAILNYIFYFKNLNESDKWGQLGESKVGEICLKILKICLFDIYKMYESIKNLKNANNFALLLCNSIEVFYINPFIKNYKEIFYFSNLKDKNYFDTSEMKNNIVFSLNYYDYENIKKKIHDVNMLIFYNFRICFQNLSNVENFNKIVHKIIYANNINANFESSFLYMALRGKSFEMDFYSSPSKFTIDDFFLLNGCVNFELVKFFLNTGANPDVFVDLTSKNTFLNYFVFENKYFNSLEKENVDKYIKLFINYGAHLDYPNKHGEDFCKLYSLAFDFKSLKRAYS